MGCQGLLHISWRGGAKHGVWGSEHSQLLAMHGAVNCKARGQKALFPFGIMPLPHCPGVVAVELLPPLMPLHVELKLFSICMVGADGCPEVAEPRAAMTASVV